MSYIRVDMNLLAFKIIILRFFLSSFQDHGSPESFQSVTSVTIRVKDADDQNPVFTRQVYKANVTEAAVITVTTPTCLSFPSPSILFSFLDTFAGVYVVQQY